MRVGETVMLVDASPDSWVLDVTCTLPAPPERVFRLLTNPSELSRWWGPHGFSTPETDVDLRVGGRYRLGMKPADGELFHLSGRYLEIEPPTRLVYTFCWEEPDPEDRETRVELSLERLSDGSRLTLHQGTFRTEARLALHRNGWADALDKLSDVAARSVDQ
jgi:uncharacterized protein YndB with AHSA1/START domain